MTRFVPVPEHELEVGDVLLFGTALLAPVVGFVPVVFISYPGGPANFYNYPDLYHPYTIRGVNPAVVDTAEVSSRGYPVFVVARDCSCGHRYDSHSDVDGSCGACTCSEFSYGRPTGDDVSTVQDQALAMAEESTKHTFVWSLREDTAIEVRTFLADSIEVAKDQADFALGVDENVEWTEAVPERPVFARTLADGTQQEITRVEVHRAPVRVRS